MENIQVKMIVKNHFFGIWGILSEKWKLKRVEEQSFVQIKYFKEILIVELVTIWIIKLFPIEQIPYVKIFLRFGKKIK